MSNTNSNFSNIICINDQTDISGFEKEISKHILSISKMTENADDIQELIVDALKRRCNDRNAIMHAHLRLKHGTNLNECKISWNELTELAEMIAFKGYANATIKRLANFYVQVAALCNRIEHVRRILNANANANANETQLMHNNFNPKLLQAYAKNEENMREKHQQNHHDLDQIMQTLFLESQIHPELVEDDLPALKMRVEHIAERGCVLEELRRLKITEALLEEKRFHELMQELKTLTTTS